MLRTVKESELDIVWKIIEEEPFGLTREMLDEVYHASKSFICIDDMKAFGFSISHGESKYELFAYVLPDFRRQGYGKRIIETLEEDLIDCEVRIENMLKYCDVSGFLKNLNYNMWYSSSLLEYEGEPFEDAYIECVDYDDQYYNLCCELRTEAFYQVRKENEIEPYLIPSSDSEREIMEKSKDQYYLHFDEDNLVGVMKIKEDHIDLLMVHKGYRGQGFGRKLLQYGTNIILEKGDKPGLYVMDTNHSARRLYESQGYAVDSTVHVYKKML